MKQTDNTSTIQDIQPRFHDKLKNVEGYSLLSSFEYDLEEISKSLDRLGHILLTWTGSTDNHESALKVRNERYKIMKAEKDAIEALKK